MTDKLREQIADARFDIFEAHNRTPLNIGDVAKNSIDLFNAVDKMWSLMHNEIINLEIELAEAKRNAAK